MYVSEFRLEDYPVRAEDVLHTGQAAFDAALNTVNVGKFNIGFASVGMCEHAIYEAVTHAHTASSTGTQSPTFRTCAGPFVDAYVRLIAMKTYGDRAIDYFRSAGPQDRRYLLFNPVTKMKMTTEGETVMGLLWDVIAAKGFERDTYFRGAGRTSARRPSSRARCTSISRSSEVHAELPVRPDRATAGAHPAGTRTTTSSCSTRARLAVWAMSPLPTGDWPSSRSPTCPTSHSSGSKRRFTRP
jgi:alkylation response protein AidB-like acyl-CoA dehydrogenase